jgi:hypothetical protein
VTCGSRSAATCSTWRTPSLPVPIAKAWVVIEEPAGRVLAQTTSDTNGRFIFTRLRQDTYRLRAGVAGRGTQNRLVDVPSPSGRIRPAVPLNDSGKE